VIADHDRHDVAALLGEARMVAFLAPTLPSRLGAAMDLSTPVQRPGGGGVARLAGAPAT